jgi:hypothetical protein
MKTDVAKTGKKATKQIFLLCMASILVLVSCSGNGTEPSYQDANAIVMQAYLFEGQRVNQILLYNNFLMSVHDSMVRIAEWNPFNQRMDTTLTLVRWVNDTNPIIENALVTISSGGVSYNIAYRDSGKYEDSSGNLKVIAGQTYRIDVFADSRHAWAETTVPSRVTTIRVSKETIVTDTVKTEEPCKNYDEYGNCIDKTKDGGKVGKVQRVRATPLPDSIARMVIKWNNPDHNYLYYRIQSVQESEYGIYQAGNYTNADSLIVTTKPDTSTSWLQGVSAFYNDTLVYLALPARVKFILYSLTSDYQKIIAGVTDTTHQDLWIKAPNNIHDGLGVFASFNASDSVFFNVVQKGGGN